MSARILLLFIFKMYLAVAHADTKLCNSIVFKEGAIELSKNERILICGSQKSVEGWREVPIPQAQYQLNVLLQNSGYLNARFERDGDNLYIWTGPLTQTKSLVVTGADGLLRPTKKRKIIGYPLTPKKLDEVKDWASLALRRQGRGCPEIEVVAHAWDREILATINPGPKQYIDSLQVSGMEGLDSSTLHRFQAFEVGDEYNVIETQLTVARMLNQGLFQSAFFTTHCRGDKIDLQLVTSVGRPRLFRFGLGASTEELPFADIWFKNTRLDNLASSFTGTIHGSNRRQSLNLDSELYLLPFTKRTFFGPRFSIKRQNERAIEDVQVKAGADLGRQFDKWQSRFQLRAGPTLNYVKTVRGIGPDNVRYLSWEGSVNIMTHPYEIFSRDQFEGWTSNFGYLGQRQGLGSPINVDRYELDFKHLWNLGHYSPPLFMLGTRIEGIGVNYRQVNLVDNRVLLPSDYRVFYGGDENLRGFARQILNNGDLGYLTVAYMGLELRMVEVLPYRLEPFLLLDMARLGNERVTLDPPIFTSHGFGVRWPSPFGTLRGSAARGRIFHETESTKSYPQEWVYFLSFGQEF